MARRLFDFDNPDRFVPGTIGSPGERTFFLQARQGGALVSVSIEKVQVAVLAERLGELLDAVRPGLAGTDPLRTSGDDGTLDEPLVDVFRVGDMVLGWDPSVERVVIEAIPIEEDGDSFEAQGKVTEKPDLVRISIDAATARAFVRRAAALLAAGRPACPFCGQVLGPDGHFCPRTILN